MELLFVPEVRCLKEPLCGRDAFPELLERIWRDARFFVLDGGTKFCKYGFKSTALSYLLDVNSTAQKKFLDESSTKNLAALLPAQAGERFATSLSFAHGKKD